MTLPPDQRQFVADVKDASFLAAARGGMWGLLDGPAAATIGWPKAVFWVGAASRKDSPDRFHLLVDCEGYPSVGPTATFWDPSSGQPLAAARWPKGKSHGQVSAVFRTDWEGGKAFYHPFDRLAAGTHPDWPTKYPHLQWSNKKTIVNFLGMIHDLLHRTDYTGV